jgi:hypothetical protein
MPGLGGDHVLNLVSRWPRGQNRVRIMKLPRVRDQARSHARLEWYFRWFTLLTVFIPLAGCISSKPTVQSKQEDHTLWKPHLLYVHRSPHPSLYVEVDAVAGTEPSDAVLNELKSFLAAYCDKPEGIQIARNDVIRRSDAVGFSHKALACRYLNGPPETNGPSNPAYLYVLYYDSRLSDASAASAKSSGWRHRGDREGYVPKINPYVQLSPFPGSIFVDQRYFATWPRVFQSLTLLHEAGHVLGLTQNAGHGTSNHCTEDACLMHETLELAFPKALYSSSKTSQTNLCEKCRADLTTGRHEAPQENLRFSGPMLIRSEEGYHVISLPSQIKLMVGDVSNFDATAFIQQIRDDATTFKGSFPGCRIHITVESRDWIPEELDAILDRAKHDKSTVVREGLEELLPELRRVMSRPSSNGIGRLSNCE